MWSDQGGEDGSFDGNEGRSEDEFLVFGPGGCRIVRGNGRRVVQGRGEHDGDDDDEVDKDEVDLDEEVEDFSWIVDDEDIKDEVCNGDDGVDVAMQDAGDMNEAGLDLEHPMDAQTENEMLAAEHGICFGGF